MKALAVLCFVAAGGAWGYGLGRSRGFHAGWLTAHAAWDHAVAVRLADHEDES